MNLAFAPPQALSLRSSGKQSGPFLNRARLRPILVSARAESNGDGNNARLPAGKGFGKSANNQPIGFVGAEKIGIAFTCNADGCNNRITKSIKRRSYEKGTVLIQCPKCQKHHVIADNTGMYAQLTGGKRNVEEMAKEKGENVTRVNTSVFDLEKLVCKY